MKIKHLIRKISFYFIINLKCKPFKNSSTFLNIALFSSTHRCNSYEILSICFFMHKINLNAVNIRANHHFWLVSPNNAPETAYKMIQYINISKIHDIAKYQVNPSIPKYALKSKTGYKNWKCFSRTSFVNTLYVMVIMVTVNHLLLVNYFGLCFLTCYM